jgi:hypothetical protein
MKPIKRLSELTFQELITISYNSEEYRQIIDLECAHAGVSLLPDHPGSKPDAAGSKPDAMLYKVGNWGFRTVTDAQDVIDAMVCKGIYAVESSSSVQVMKPMERDGYYWPEIKSIPAYTPEAFALIKDDVGRTAKLLADWKEKDSEYQSVLKERQSIITEFETKKQYANEVLTGIAKIRDNLKRYLTLAQGSYPIAITFLHEADKHGTIRVSEDDTVYFLCSNGEEHLVITREQHQKESMGDLLGTPV